MNSLRLPPLNFDALPTRTPNQCELPPISLSPHISNSLPPQPSRTSCNRQQSESTLPLLPSLSPLLTETASVFPTRPSPIASYRQSYSKTCSSPTSSSSSTPVLPSFHSPIPAQSTEINSLRHSNSFPPRSHSQPLPPPPLPLSFESNVTPVLTTDVLPANIPIAPIKRTIQTPKGIREVYTCPFHSCTRISSEHSNMKAHMRLHTGERPYVCRVASCRKSFRWKSSLTYHERALHSNSRPYQCIPCRKSFVEKRKLRLHHQLCPAVRAAQSEILQYGSLKVPAQPKSH